MCITVDVSNQIIRVIKGKFHSLVLKNVFGSKEKKTLHEMDSGLIIHFVNDNL